MNRLITKYQIPSTKQTPITNHQTPNGLVIGTLVLGACLEFGIWCLVISMGVRNG
jgi:hypothetical protein